MRRRQQGIVLVASLLIMVAIMAMGFGSLFLTQMNFHIAENARTSTQARYHAEAGLDHALLLLEDHYRTNKDFPLTLPSSSMPFSVINGQNYRLLARDGDTGYRRFTQPDRAMVRIEGFTDNNGRHVVEAIFGAAIYSAFQVGLATEGQVRVSGGGQAEFLNAGIYANGQIRLPGYGTTAFTNCTVDTSGNCVGATTTANPTPVWGVGGVSPCDLCTSNNAERVHVNPDYQGKRNKAIRESFVAEGAISSSNSTEAIMANTTPNNEMRCSTVYTQTTASPIRDLSTLSATQIEALGPVICIENGNAAPAPPNRPVAAVGAVNLPTNVNLSGVTIIADGNIHFGSTALCTSRAAGSLSNVKLISKFGGVWMNAVSGNNLTVFSGDDDGNSATADPGGNICDNKNNPTDFLITDGYDLRGYTTIASAANIEFKGKTYVTTRPNLADAITIAIISSNNITNSGSFPYYGTFWAGGVFSQSGESVIYGTVTTVGDITVSGRLKIRNVYAIDNPNLMGDISIVSRR